MKKINTILESYEYRFDNTQKKFGTGEIEICTAYKCVPDAQNKILAKYLILDLRNMNEKLVVENFIEFQKRYIAEIFYLHRDDIRWNIYTLIIVNSKENLQEDFLELERNEDYSRKFIFDVTELEEFLKYGFFGNIDISAEQTIKTDFTLDWNTELEKYGLNGCITNKMKLDSIESYINEEKPIRPIGRPQSNKTNTNSKEKYIVKRIDNIYLQNYREHCFKNKFSFAPGLINLISGSNGSGKSSICEAISLGMSGTNSSLKKDSENKVKLFCINNEDEKVVLNSTKTAVKSRELDLTWYGTTTTGTKSRLYENFTIFNYLQPKTIFASMKHDIHELIKNIIYGDETTIAWKNILNYKNKFETQKKSLNDLRKEKQVKINELDKRLTRLLEEQSLNDKTYEDEFGFLSSLPSDMEISEKQDIMNEAQFNVSILEPLLTGDYERVTYDDVYNSLKNSSSNMLEISEKRDKLIKAEKDKEQLVIKKKSNKVRIDEMHSKMKDIEQTKREYQTVGFKYSNKDEMQHYEENYNKILIKKEKLIRLYEEFKHLSIIDIEVDFDKESKIKKIDEKRKLVSERKRVGKELVERQKDSDTLKSVLDNIYKFAKEYQELNKHNSKCPLCGHDFKIVLDINEAIDDTRKLCDSKDQSINSLILRNQQLLGDLQKIDVELSQINEQEKVYNEVNELIKNARDIHVEVEIEVAHSILATCLEDIEKLDKQLKSMNNGMEFIRNIVKKHCYIEFLKNENSVDFFSFLDNMFKTIKDEIAEILEEDEGIDKELVALHTKLLQKDVINREFNCEKKELDVLEEISECLSQVRELFENLNSNTEIKTWCREFTVSKMVLDEKAKREIENEYRKSIEADLKISKNALVIIENKYDRCNVAIKTFNSLTSLDENMSVFIESNAKQIERIFKMIHRPEEFTNLIIEKGHIKFIRKTTKEIIDINSISTGQAMALVFAVTISLHFSSKTVPNILIFDEPVANLDDVHIMNLVDMLKEIAIMGVQIFITTANDQVATFFRRKFSCFIENFKHLEISRTDEKPSVFTEKIYSPYKESAKARNLVAV